MKKKFVPTENYRRFTEAIKRLETRGAREAGYLLVLGAPGRGKSNICEGWAAQSAAIFLRAKEGWTPTRFMRELATELKVDAGNDNLFDALLKRLAAVNFPAIVIDEVQHCLARNAAVLEKIRDFSDSTHSPVILVAGADGVLNRIRRYEAIASRIAEHIEFSLASLDDVALICRQLGEVEIKPDLAAQIHKEAKGVLRLVMNAISTVESVAKTNGLAVIDAAKFKAANVPLCVDWQTAGSRRAA